MSPRIPINITTGTLSNDIIVGIDLGTTNSLISIVHPENKKPIILKDIDGLSMIPSVIHFDNNKGIQVGAEAKKKLLEDPENTIFSVKRLMGKSFEELKENLSFLSYNVVNSSKNGLLSVRIQGKDYSPIELSSLILKELKKRAEHILHQPINKAVISVPAYFNDSQRQATKDAARLAELDVLRVINEPTAASIAYGITNDAEQEKHILVYDLGGGTFDVSVLKIQNGIYEVLSTNGDTYLGGDDIDNIIIHYWKKSFLASKIDYSKTEMQQLRVIAEKAKKELSSKNVFEINFDDAKLSLDKKTFEKLIQPFVEKTIHLCQKALDDADLKTTDIHHTVLVGGSTRIPLIKNALQNHFNKKPHDSLNPDEVVALGSAVQADIIAGNQKDILLLDIISLSLGIEIAGGLMDVLIPKNTKIPYQVTRQYSTQKDGQTGIVVSLYQGERDIVKDNRKLGEFILKGIPPMPAGLPKVEITFSVNTDSILTVKAKELRSNVEQQIEVKPQYGLTDEYIENLLLESMTHAKEDIEKRAIIQAKSDGQKLLEDAEKFIAQHKNTITNEEIKNTASAMQNLQLSITLDKKDLINEKIDQLNEITTPLAERVMDKTINDNLKGKSI